jgi:hypothetical protein
MDQCHHLRARCTTEGRTDLLPYKLEWKHHRCMVDMKIVSSERSFGNFTKFSYTRDLHTVCGTLVTKSEHSRNPCKVKKRRYGCDNKIEILSFGEKKYHEQNHKLNNKDSFSRHNYVSLQRKYLLYKTMHVSKYCFPFHSLAPENDT